MKVQRVQYIERRGDYDTACPRQLVVAVLKSTLDLLGRILCNDIS